MQKAEIYVRSGGIKSDGIGLEMGECIRKITIPLYGENHDFNILSSARDGFWFKNIFYPPHSIINFEVKEIKETEETKEEKQTGVSHESNKL